MTALLDLTYETRVYMFCVRGLNAFHTFTSHADAILVHFLTESQSVSGAVRGSRAQVRPWPRFFNDSVESQFFCHSLLSHG